MDKKVQFSHNHNILELIEKYEYTVEYPPNLPDAYSYDNMLIMLDASDEIYR